MTPTQASPEPRPAVAPSDGKALVRPGKSRPRAAAADGCDTRSATTAAATETATSPVDSGEEEAATLRLRLAAAEARVSELEAQVRGRADVWGVPMCLVGTWLRGLMWVGAV